MMTTLPRQELQKGSVIAITVLFMSFLLIGIVGAAYLLSLHLRITSLGTDYLQATYNAESALELSLYQLKHRREGYETDDTLAWKSATGPQENDTPDRMKSSIVYRMEPGEIASIPLLGSSSKIALFYEDKTGIIHDLKSMSGLMPELSVSTGQTEIGDCLEVNLVGVFGTDHKTESISTTLPCTGPNSFVNLGSLKDDNPRTYSLAAGQPYPFDKFLATHTEVLLLLNDASQSQKAQVQLRLRNGSEQQTVSSPMKKVTAEGTFGTTVIRKFIEIPQDQLPDLLSRVLVQ